MRDLHEFHLLNLVFVNLDPFCIAGPRKEYSVFVIYCRSDNAGEHHSGGLKIV